MRFQQSVPFEFGRLDVLFRASVRQDYSYDHERRDDERGGDAAQLEAAFFMRLGERVAERGPERARQDVCGPEENAARNLREEVRQRHERDQAGEDERAALEAEARVVCGEIAERRAERVRDEDGQPVEDLVPFRDDVLELYAPHHAMPDEEDCEDAAEQYDGRLHVTESERAVEIVGHGRADGRRGDDDGPVDERAITPRRNLRGERDGEEAEEDQTADGVAEFHRHRDGVAARLDDDET